MQPREVEVVVSPSKTIHQLIQGMYGCSTMWQPHTNQVTDIYKVDVDGFMISKPPEGFKFCKHCFKYVKTKGQWYLNA